MKYHFLNIKLEHHIEELTEVNINAKVDKKTNTAQETIIDNEIIERYSALSLGDAIKENSWCFVYQYRKYYR